MPENQGHLSPHGNSRRKPCKAVSGLRDRDRRFDSRIERCTDWSGNLRYISGRIHQKNPFPDNRAHFHCSSRWRDYGLWGFDRERKGTGERGVE